MVSAPTQTRDALRLAFGTLTAFRVPSPDVVDERAAARALLLAVLPGAVLGGFAALWVAAAHTLGLPGLVIGAGAVAVLAVATRALHLDGLADTVDGLGASHSEAKALRVMATGDVGPMGVVALVVVLLAQAAAFGELAHHPFAIACVVAASRAACAVPALRGWKPARPGGLGAVFIGGAAPGHVALQCVAVVAACAAFTNGWTGAAAALACYVAMYATCRFVSPKIGGLTGDVMGAGVELALTAGLVTLLVVS